MRHFLHCCGWEPHAWRPRVTFAENVQTHDTNMWGRVVHSHAVRCQKHEVCDICGKTRNDVSCICDTEHGRSCAILQTWLQESGRELK